MESSVDEQISALSKTHEARLNQRTFFNVLITADTQHPTPPPPFLEGSIDYKCTRHFANRRICTFAHVSTLNSPFYSAMERSVSIETSRVGIVGRLLGSHVSTRTLLRRSKPMKTENKLPTLPQQPPACVTSRFLLVARIQTEKTQNKPLKVWSFHPPPEIQKCLF